MRPISDRGELIAVKTTEISEHLSIFLSYSPV